MSTIPNVTFNRGVCDKGGRSYPFYSAIPVLGKLSVSRKPAISSSEYCSLPFLIISVADKQINISPYMTSASMFYISFMNYFVAGLASSAILRKNNKYLSVLNTWLQPVVQSKSSIWKRCWRASVDGWAASTFHSGCDNKGPTVTIIKVGQYIFGGYTSASWSK